MPEASEREILDHPNVIAVPPVLHLVAILLGVAAHWYLRIEFSLDLVFRAVVGWTLVGVGIATSIWFSLAFRRTGQDRHPNTPTPAIITTGLYRYSRNPAYVALVAIQVGVALLLDNVWILVTLLPALVVIHYGVIIREEVYLERRFGDEYLRYKANVRRWL
jgi:protein-S-isoprenylcysteine O-methyltransferase Ste14